MADEVLSIAYPSDEELNKPERCCMCLNKGQTLLDLMTGDQDEGVKAQAKLLIEMGYSKEDRFCEECFYK